MNGGGDIFIAPSAQRRPGPRPRRHAISSSQSSFSNSAQRRPGPRPRRHKLTLDHTPVCGDAQRRPGPRPRRHLASVVLPRARVTRSTKAGAETPATHLGDRSAAAQLLRSTKAGAETPATPTASLFSCATVCSLNEGRGRDPGDTPSVPLLSASPSALNEGRGRDPGDTARSRRPRHSQTTRSTKAGAETPATRGRPCHTESRGSSLNEGRGRDPGDTHPWHVRSFWTQVVSAQRRPGPRPRRHALLCSRSRLWSGKCSLNEGRGRDPGDTANRRGTPSWTQLGTRSADA